MRGAILPRRAAIGLGVDDRSIGLLDAAGVNFAGVKALEARTTALQAENAGLRAQNRRLEETAGAPGSAGGRRARAVGSRVEKNSRFR